MSHLLVFIVFLLFTRQPVRIVGLIVLAVFLVIGAAVYLSLRS